MLTYAGIGSRETPDEILHIMTLIGEQLADKWKLRSGFADGADQAFQLGADQKKGAYDIFLPWSSFNNAHGFRPNNPDIQKMLVIEPTSEAWDIARAHHPAWDRCSPGAQRMHARNVCQVLGSNYDEPADAIICWTAGGKGKGGTGQALRIAETYNIPIFDLAIKARHQDLVDFINAKELIFY